MVASGQWRQANDNSVRQSVRQAAAASSQSVSQSEPVLSTAPAYVSGPRGRYASGNSLAVASLRRTGATSIYANQLGSCYFCPFTFLLFFGVVAYTYTCTLCSGSLDSMAHFSPLLIKAMPLRTGVAFYGNGVNVHTHR